MVVKKKYTALGRGLDALISTEKVNTAGSGSICEIAIEQILPNPNQPRREFDESALQELSDSIRELGIVQPITLRDQGDGTYLIIAGERRWRASQMAGLKAIPAYVRTVDDENMMEMALIENIQREDLNPIEEAQAYKRLLTEFNLKQDEVAERVSKSRTAVTNSMRLLKLCDEVQQMVINDMLTTGHARALLSIEDPKQQYILAQKIFDEKLSVREIEKIVKDIQKIAENSKVAIRSIRRDAIDSYKTAKKNGEVTEDDLKGIEKNIQDIIDEQIKEIDKIAEKKNKEIMEI